MARFLDSIPESLRDPATFGALRAAADSPKFSPQFVPVIDTCLREALASGSELNEAPRAFRWPEDHGMHLDFANEWYFLVSNLTIANGAGKMALVTVPMRYTAAPPTLRQELGWSDFEAQVVDSVVKLTLVTDERTTSYQRAWNISAGLMGDLELSTAPFKVECDTFGIDRFEGAAYEPFPMRTFYKGAFLTVNLEHERGAPYFFQGDRGYMPVAPGDRAGYLYYSAPQIRTHGTIEFMATTYEVSGVSWFDHQWGTATPARPDPTSTRSGWVWFGFNFDDGSAVTFAAPHDPASPKPDTYLGEGKYVPPATSDSIPAGPIEGTLIAGELTITDHFTSPQTGAIYPCGWDFEIVDWPSKANPIKITATPWAKNQLGLFASLQEFWEGGADLVKTDAQGNQVKGQGFCEAVGFEPFDHYFKRALKFFQDGGASGPPSIVEERASASDRTTAS
jgi:predicted secreted hydrolase